MTILPHHSTRAGQHISWRSAEAMNLMVHVQAPEYCLAVRLTVRTAAAAPQSRVASVAPNLPSLFHGFENRPQKEQKRWNRVDGHRLVVIEQADAT